MARLFEIQPPRSLHSGRCLFDRQPDHVSCNRFNCCDRLCLWPVAGFLLQGFFYGMVGSISGALFTYTIGYLLGHGTFRHLAGSRFEALNRALSEKGLTAIITTHLIPFGPFTLVNLSAGVVHVRLWDFILGSTIGLLPGVALITIFEQQLEHAFGNLRLQRWYWCLSRQC